MTTLLKDLAADKTFALKDPLIAALAKMTPVVATVDDLCAVDGRRLLSKPPNETLA